jgi:hypothetical protein
MEDTNWREIASLYGVLERMTGNPMVPLNRAIAVRDGRRRVGRARTSGAALGAACRPPPPTCGARLLLEMPGEVDAALAGYETDASRSTSVPADPYLTMRRPTAGDIDDCFEVAIALLARGPEAMSGERGDEDRC